MPRLLGEIHHDPGLDSAAGRVVERTAVRAVALRGRELLLLHSPVNADYKFPGGGVEPGESPHDALRREVMEECGAQVESIDEDFGDIVEYSVVLEPDADVFRMTSRYIRCRITSVFGAQRLERYEQDLKLKPTWVDIDEALRVNTAAQRAVHSVPPARWRSREILALRLIRRDLLDPKP